MALVVGSFGFAFTEPTSVAFAATTPNSPTTNAATGITTSDATLNGTNGPADAIGHSFWASLAPFDTSSPTIPSGTYSTPDMGPIASSTPFSAALSSMTGMPPVTPSTTYYFAAWSNVEGTWSSGEILSFTTAPEVATTTASTTAVVTINKYVDGAPATAVTASSSDFQMNATYTINGNSGSGQYALSAAGYNGDPTPYQAKTSDLPLGSDYGTNEIMDSVVGATESSSTPFSLVGYTTGDSFAEAAAGTPSTTTPNFTNITSDKYVIVWNKSYVAPVGTTTPPTSVKVTINKFINGAQATAATASSSDFAMNAVYNSVETGSGSGTYNLSASGFNGDPTPYQAKTIDMTPGADYATNEIFTGAVVGETCAASSSKPFALDGYTTGNSFAEAMAATKSTSSPSFVGLTSDKYVIVWNKTCGTTEGTIEGDVEGGVSTSTVGVLHVDSITAEDTTATADGTYGNGWRYVFNITVPTNETHLSMKFADWFSSASSSTLPAANNMRISSSQADNGGATVTVTAANAYTTPALNMTGDLNGALAGKQIQVLVEVKIPSTTVNGNYSTSYGVKTI